MKKLLILLSLLLIISTLMLVGCASEEQLPDAPTGYKMYSNSDIYFAHPDGWNVREVNGVVQIIPNAGGNNITLSKGQYDPSFDNLTLEAFNEILLPSITASGAKLSEATLKHDTTKGFDIAIVNYKLSQNNISVEQTLYMFNAGGGTYSIIITEATEDLTLIRNVFNTLTIK